MRAFNIAGPCFPDTHYMLPPERRLGEIMELVELGHYFTLHAGRQTGKTTSAQWLVEHYNAGDRFAAIWVVARDLPDLGVPADRERLLDDPETAVLRYLHDLAARSARPLVVLVDEADCLVGAAMVSLLTQLRHGYIDRRKLPFPHSIGLIGQRTSPFNVSSEALTLTAFTEVETLELLAQHTADTGQRFEPEAALRIYELSQGQPWLVNALADRVVRRDVRDRSVPITAAHVLAAKETLILERRTHIDSLVAKLREPRVRRVIDPMLAGERATGDALDDDFAYVVGLGLLRSRAGHFEIANPIYREVIPRALTYIQQMQIAEEPAAFVRSDGTLDVPKLMTAWQTFWRKDGHLAAEGFGYRESGPHLMLMAFLQRVVNGGGRVEREYGLGKGALDLMIEWQGDRHAIEVKLRRDTETEADALEQVARSLDRAGLEEGWLVMFDLRSTLPWTERLSQRVIDAHGKRVHVVGC